MGVSVLWCFRMPTHVGILGDVPAVPSPLYGPPTLSACTCPVFVQDGIVQGEFVPMFTVGRTLMVKAHVVAT
jgi:hypothetical protein